MALNPNHTFEDLGETKYSIAEKNCTPERTDFLKKLLEHNGFTVIVAKSPPPKVAKPTPPKPAAQATDSDAPVTALPTIEDPALLPTPETYTVGVTDLTFSPINAVFNRELKTFDGAIVNTVYWKQRETAFDQDKWYWEKELQKS